MTGLLGGAFDPPHVGHVALAEAAERELGLSEVVVVVVADPGHKQVFSPVETRLALAQAPWERAANNLATTFTGPLARSLALVAIVIGGLMFMFGEAGAKRQISGIVFGGGLALFAAQFLLWLF